MSILSQFLGLDARSQPQYPSQNTFSYDKILAELKSQREASKKAAEDRAAAEKLAADQAAYQDSVAKAQSLVAGNASLTASQIQSGDQQQMANDAAIAATKIPTTAGAGYDPNAAKQAYYGNIGAASSGAAEGQKKIAPAAYAASEQTNKTGSQSNRFNLPDTKGITFGGAA